MQTTEDTVYIVQRRNVIKDTEIIQNFKPILSGDIAVYE